MHFVMDGEEFELTAELVRSRLRGRVPDNIQEHWVEVDGQRWPVKQVLAIATGASRRRFVSQTARRHLRNLGFLVSDDGTPRASISGSQRSVPRAFDPASLPALAYVNASVALTWRAAGQVTLDQHGLPNFPPLPRLPGLYRFQFQPLYEADAHPTVYVRESIELARRGNNYRTPKLTDRDSGRVDGFTRSWSSISPAAAK